MDVNRDLGASLPLEKSSIIVLTEKATSMRDRYQFVSIQMNDIFYKGFSDEEIAQFDNTLAIVLKNLKDVEG